MERIREQDWKLRIKEDLGAGDKMSFKHTLVNSQATHDLNPLKSMHAMRLQRSPYVTVENSIGHLRKYYSDATSKGSGALSGGELLGG